MKLITLAISVLVGILVVRAEDIKTADGKTYRKIQDVKTSEVGISFKHEDGVGKVSTERLPEGDYKKQCQQLSVWAKKEQAAKDAKQAEVDANRAAVVAESSLVECGACRVIYAFCPNKLTKKEEPGWVYACDLTNPGGKPWAGKIRLTISGKSPTSVETKEEEVIVKPGEPLTFFIVSRMAPAPEHGIFSMTHWKVDADGEELKTGIIPREFKDLVTGKP